MGWRLIRDADELAALGLPAAGILLLLCQKPVAPPLTRLLDQEVRRGVIPVGKARPFRERALFLFYLALNYGDECQHHFQGAVRPAIIPSMPDAASQ
jgi:hypothetical protein